jgi:uncharacterized cupredoxin-like copper-binding protein
MPVDRIRRALPTIVCCLLVTVLAVSLLAASSGAPRPLRLSSDTLSVRLREYSITPAAVSVPPGTLRIVAHNAGILVHNLTVDHSKVSTNGERAVIASTHTIAPGKSRTVEVQLHTPGRYTLSSTIANQADLGMTATLTVR